MAAESHPPASPGQQHPQGHAEAEMQSLDTHRLMRGGTARSQSPCLLLPSSGIHGRFSLDHSPRHCRLKPACSRGGCPEAPSVGGIRMLSSRSCPPYLLLVLVRITIRNPSPGPVRSSVGAVQRGLLGLNIDCDVRRRRRKQDQELGREETHAQPLGGWSGSCLCVLPVPACSAPSQLSSEGKAHPTVAACTSGATAS